MHARLGAAATISPFLLLFILLHISYVSNVFFLFLPSPHITGIIGRPFAEDEGANPIWGVVPEANGGNGIVQGVDTSSQNANHGTDVVTISRSHTGNAGSIVDSNLTGKTALYAGGSGYKSLLLLEDRAEAYVHVTKIKVWDVCAGEALVRSAGGAFTNTKGTFWSWMMMCHGCMCIECH